jgi:hypothetical protein
MLGVYSSVVAALYYKFFIPDEPVDFSVLLKLSAALWLFVRFNLYQK